MKGRIYLGILLVFILGILGCKQLDTSIQLHQISNGKWAQDNKAKFNFNLGRPNGKYLTYIIVRHTNDYKYNNLFVNINYKIDSNKENSILHYEIPLTKNNTEWAGKVFNNVIEARIPANIFTDEQLMNAKQVQISLENIMREDPLEEMLQVGLMFQPI
jgi:gliding motility-associated lipoprotein GldH